MPLPTYYIDTTLGRAIIKSRLNKTEMAIYELNDEPFTDQPGYLTMYANNDGQLLAFVPTQRHARIKEITAALQWYASEIGNPAMDITPIDPRPPVKLRIVR